MKLKEIFKVFGEQPLSEILFLFTLIVVWSEHLIKSPMEFIDYFLLVVMIVFVISRIGIRFYEAFEEEENKK